jgi:hypothetical protein
MPYGKSNKSIQDSAFKLRSGNKAAYGDLQKESPVKALPLFLIPLIAKGLAVAKTAVAAAGGMKAIVGAVKAGKVIAGAGKGIKGITTAAKTIGKTVKAVKGMKIAKKVKTASDVGKTIKSMTSGSQTKFGDPAEEFAKIELGTTPISKKKKSPTRNYKKGYYGV